MVDSFRGPCCGFQISWRGGRGFDAKQICKRRSEDLRKEFTRLALLKWETVAHYDEGAEAEIAKAVLAEQGRKALAGGSKRSNKRTDSPGAKVKRRKL